MEGFLICKRGNGTLNTKSKSYLGEEIRLEDRNSYSNRGELTKGPLVQTLTCLYFVP